MKLLLTGFEPFGGSAMNPSEKVVQALAQQPMTGIELQTAVLPVSRIEGPKMLIQAVEQGRPDVVLCLGEAGRRASLSIERIAINLLDYGIADNSGNQVMDEAIVIDGPDAYFTTLPVRAMFDAVRLTAVPVELSLTAGAFLCNQVTYELLHYLALNKLKVPAGFMHLPRLPEQVTPGSFPSPSMDLATMCLGVRVVIEALARAYGEGGEK